MSDTAVWDLSIMPSPDDERDHIAEEVFLVAHGERVTVPSTLDLRPQLRPVRDQGSTSTCAAQTAACMREYQELHDTKVSTDFSPQFIYHHRVNAPSLGMYGRDVMRILHKIGASTEKSYPFGSTNDPSEAVMTEASKYKIKEYARVGTIGAVKEALVTDGPCFIAFPVYNYGTRMWKPRPGEKRRGGHAMAVVGYTKQGFIIRNSWGANWGDKGHCIYPYGDFGAHWEIWTTVDRKGSAIPDEPPSPSKWHCGICEALFRMHRKRRDPGA